LLSEKGKKLDFVLICHLFCFFFFFQSWELASALKESKQRFDAAGVKLIAVGVGTPDKARILADRVGLFLSLHLFSAPETLYSSIHTIC
jgi:hypothetical protein